MLNLLNTLSDSLQDKLEDYVVTEVYIYNNEVNVTSYYDMDQSYYEAIENELKALGHNID